MNNALRRQMALTAAIAMMKPAANNTPPPKHPRMTLIACAVCVALAFPTTRIKRFVQSDTNPSGWVVEL